MLKNLEPRLSDHAQQVLVVLRRLIGSCALGQPRSAWQAGTGLPKRTWVHHLYDCHNIQIQIDAVFYFAEVIVDSVFRLPADRQ